MQTRSIYFREALIAGCVTGSVTALVAAAIVAAGADMVGEFLDQVVARALLVLFAFYAALLFTLPAAIPVALGIPRLRVWSVAAVALIFCLVVLASSAASCVSDPLSLRGRDKQSLWAYFSGGKWAFSLFNALGIVSGSIGAFVAFEVIRRERIEKLHPSSPGVANSQTTR